MSTQLYLAQGGCTSVQNRLARILIKYVPSCSVPGLLIQCLWKLLLTEIILLHIFKLSCGYRWIQCIQQQWKNKVIHWGLVTQLKQEYVVLYISRPHGAFWQWKVNHKMIKNLHSINALQDLIKFLGQGSGFTFCYKDPVRKNVSQKRLWLFLWYRKMKQKLNYVSFERIHEGSGHTTFGW